MVVIGSFNIVVVGCEAWVAQPQNTKVRADSSQPWQNCLECTNEREAQSPPLLREPMKSLAFRQIRQCRGEVWGFTREKLGSHAALEFLEFALRWTSSLLFQV